MKYRFSLFAFVVVFAPGGLFFAYDRKQEPESLKPGRKYATIERLRPERLRAVSEDRARYQRLRRPVSLETGYNDFRAVLHAHAEDSDHTGGTRFELLAAARATGVQVVMLSDHVNPPRDFINDSWRGLKDGVLFIPGAESEGFLVYPRRSIIKAHIEKTFSTREDYIKLVKSRGGVIFLSHVEDKADWETGEIDGLEIYNHHTDLADEGEFVKWLGGSFTAPNRLKQIQQALAAYPMEVFGASQDYLEQIIARWDRDLIDRRVTGVAANDCHHNQVFTIKAFPPDAIRISVPGESPRKITVEENPRIAEMVKNRQPGEVIADLDFDPYERSLRYVTTHLLMRDLNEDSVRQALRQSHVYVAHDWLCDPTGFAFIVEESGGKRIGVMGDQKRLEEGMKLRLEAPVPSLCKLVLDGRLIHESDSGSFSYEVARSGVYRAEVWLEVGGEMRPWIYSNPIRITR